VIHVSLMEKILVLLLAKIANLVPDGGIWMNTQRPEWNDANNALVGKGISVVTAAYLRRFIAFWQDQLAGAENESYRVNTAVAALFSDVQSTLAAHLDHLQSSFSDVERRAVMDELGAAASAYRATVYANGVSQKQVALSKQAVANLLTLAQHYIEQTLRANHRPDGLYHAYNILRLGTETTAVENLYLMLEGQVAILSSGLLDPDEALELLRSLRHSDLYRADQHSYMLYPHRQLPGFRRKNNIPAAKVYDSPLVTALMANGDTRLLVLDEAGVYHFNGHFRNANDAVRVLDDLAREPAYDSLVAAERGFILDLFEETFNHRAFTGRSGTFFAYEGLGSIYWHMVSKLLLAAQESYLSALVQGADKAVIEGLAAAYDDIRAGLGFNKSPEAYGAFPTDPYSHTPWGDGARQPGMTGQVKEEILTRFGELGVSIRNGALHFRPTLLNSEEYLPEPSHFSYIDEANRSKTIDLPPASLAFTVCQTPVVYVRGKEARIEVTYRDGRAITLPGYTLDPDVSRHIFDRDGQIEQLSVTVEG
jgi:hypothetical protein